MTTTGLERRAVTDWPLVMVLGVFNLIVGIVAVAWPEETLTVVVIIFGLQLLVMGVLRIVSTLAGDQRGPAWLQLLGGIVAVVVGLLVMQEPLRSLAVIVTLLGIFWVFWGIVALVTAFSHEAEEDRSVYGIDGLLSLGLGIVLLVWPAPTVQVVTLLIGIFLIVGGIAAIGLSIAMWSESRNAPPAAPAY